MTGNKNIDDFFQNIRNKVRNPKNDKIKTLDTSAMSKDELIKAYRDLESSYHDLELKIENSSVEFNDIQKSLNKYSFLYDFAPIGYITLNKEGVIQDANLTASNFIGVDRFRLISRHLELFLDKSYWEVFNFHRQQVFSSHKKQVCEVLLVRSDGRKIFVQLESITIRDKFGVYNQLLTTMVDITRRKDIENQIRMAHDEMDQIFNVSGDGLLVLDCEMNVIHVNSMMGTLFNFTPGRILNKYCKQFLPQSIFNVIKDAHYKIMHGQHSIEMDILDQPIADEHLSFLLTATAYNDLTGKLIGVICNFKDITDRVHYEQALEKEKELLSITLKNTADAVITVSSDQRIVLMNPVAEKLSGYSLKEAKESHFSEIFTMIDENTNLSSDILSIVMKNTKANQRHYEPSLVARDGTIRKVIVSASSITDKFGEVTGAVVVLRDNTEYQRLQKEQTNTTIIESRSIMAKGIAHDFNNILTSILGGIDLIRLEIKHDKKGDELLVDVEKAAQRAKKLTHQLQIFANSDLSTRKEINVQTIIDDSISLVLRKSGFTPAIEIEKQLWSIIASEDQFRQVIVNLIQNAIQSNAVDKWLGLRIKNMEQIEVQEAGLTDGNYIKLSIEDHGDGIDSDTLPKVFDPYFTTKQEHSGLGLASAQAIVKNHGGKLDIFSRPNEGTTISLYIPATGNAASTPEISEAPVTDKNKLEGKGRILILDDEIDILNVTKKALIVLGYECEVFSNSETAVKAFKTAKEKRVPFDLVFLDLILPSQEGGIEVFLKMREIDPEIRGILTTGDLSDASIMEYSSYGFASCVGKPFTLIELGQAVKSGMKEDN